MKRTHLPLLLWVAIALFPFAWLTALSADYAHVFNSVFDLEPAHIAMLALIFAGLAVLRTASSGNHCSVRWLVIVSAFVTLVALAQEVGRLWYKGHGWTAAETSDLATAWTGRLIGLCAS